MKIDVAIQPRHLRWKTLLRPYCKTVREACGAALRQMTDDGWRMADMTVVLADDAFIQDLNKTYRGKDKATNVLAFANADTDPSSVIRHPSSGDAKRHLGDLVLAIETIEREALDQGKSFKDHTKHLLVHGTLHLLGYDHENEKDAARMERFEVKILKTLGVANPYL